MLLENTSSPLCLALNGCDGFDFSYGIPKCCWNLLRVHYALFCLVEMALISLMGFLNVGGIYFEFTMPCLAWL